LRFIFKLKFILNPNYFKMASVRVLFSPGFTNGGGFPAEQFLLLLYSILLAGNKTRGAKFGRFLVNKQCCNPDHDYRKMRETIEEYTWCSANFKYQRSKNLTVCSPGKSLLCGVPNTAGATFCGKSSSNEH
jgi:hypothetical protein